MNKQEKKVFDEVTEAYADCWLPDDTPWPLQESRRNLHFRASAPVKLKVAHKILKNVFPGAGGYNNFSPDLLLKLHADTMVTIAREGSVCLYVDRKPPSVKTMDCDECDQQGKEWRLWWD